MYVLNTFRGHIKLQKDFRWTVWRSNIDIMIHADENKIILMIFLLLKFSVKVFDVPVCLIYMLFSLKKYYCYTPDILQTHIFPCFILQHICNIFNMCNVLFVIEWNSKAIFLIVQLP